VCARGAASVAEEAPETIADYEPRRDAPRHDSELLKQISCVGSALLGRDRATSQIVSFSIAACLCIDIAGHEARATRIKPFNPNSRHDQANQGITTA
jgi:hypothetical protein